MPTRDNYAIDRGIVRSANPITGVSMVEMPGPLAAGGLVGVSNVGLTQTVPGLYDVPLPGSMVFVAFDNRDRAFLVSPNNGAAASVGAISFATQAANAASVGAIAFATQAANAASVGAVNALAAHVAAADPHPQYLTAAKGNAAYSPLSPTWTAWNSKVKSNNSTANITSTGVWSYDGNYINMEVGWTSNGAMTAGGNITVDIPVTAITPNNGGGNAFWDIGSCGSVNSAVAHEPVGRAILSGVNGPATLIDPGYAAAPAGWQGWSATFPHTWKSGDWGNAILRYRWQ